jgi:hypothetical protein
MVPSRAADPNHQTQLWRSNQRVRFHHLLGNERPSCGGSQHDTGQSSMVSDKHEYPQQQLDACSEYLSKYGSLLPPEMTEASAARIRADFRKVLERHPWLLKKTHEVGR